MEHNKAIEPEIKDLSILGSYADKNNSHTCASEPPKSLSAAILLLKLSRCHYRPSSISLRSTHLKFLVISAVYSASLTPNSTL